MTGYIIKVGDNHYIKRTCRFGAFHGSVVYTDKIGEARVWSREKDANNAMRTAAYRITQYNHDKRKYPGGTMSVEKEIG